MSRPKQCSVELFFVMHIIQLTKTQVLAYPLLLIIIAYHVEIS